MLELHLQSLNENELVKTRYKELKRFVEVKGGVKAHTFALKVHSCCLSCV